MEGFFFRTMGLEATPFEATPLSEDEITRIEENLYRATVIYSDPVEGNTDAEGDFKRLIASLRAARMALVADPGRVRRVAELESELAFEHELTHTLILCVGDYHNQIEALEERNEELEAALEGQRQLVVKVHNLLRSKEGRSLKKAIGKGWMEALVGALDEAEITRLALDLDLAQGAEHG